MAQKIIEVNNLRTYFHTDDAIAKAVDGVSFDVFQGETLGIVGESGSGKSVTALSIMQLIPQPPGFFDGGEILFEGENVLDMEANELRHIRGNQISMIFQEPMTSLNPVFTCGDQISESIMLHQGLNKIQAHKKAIEMLDMVGIPDPQHRVKEYPHQLSGGMRQRVMIAIALSCNPKVLIADEPTTALDVTIQAQILELIADLQKQNDLSVIMITHDLGVIAEISDRVIVMYAGQIVEQGTAQEIFKSNLHPYTQGLLKSIPNISQDGAKSEELHTIPGIVPNATEFPKGCHFHPRCDRAVDKCHSQQPRLEPVGRNRTHKARCWEI